MKPNEFRKTLNSVCDRHKLLMPNISDLIGVGVRQLQRYITGQHKVPPPVEKLLTLLDKGTLKPSDLES